MKSCKNLPCFITIRIYSITHIPLINEISSSYTILVEYECCILLIPVSVQPVVKGTKLH